MDRNDQIFFSAVGGALAVSVLVGAIASYATNQTVSNWVQALLTLAAICVAIAIPTWTEAKKHALRQRAAEVVIAAKLRTWLRLAAKTVEENLQFRGTGGHDGTYSIDIPEFEIEPKEVAEIGGSHARQLLDLVERRARRQNDIYTARYYSGDDTEGMMEFFSQTAHLFWSAARIYKELAQTHQLETATNRKSEVGSIKNAAQIAKKYFDLQAKEF